MHCQYHSVITQLDALKCYDVWATTVIRQTYSISGSDSLPQNIMLFVASILVKPVTTAPASLAQLVETMHNLCRGSNSWQPISPHLRWTIFSHIIAVYNKFVGTCVEIELKD